MIHFNPLYVKLVIVFYFILIYGFSTFGWLSLMWLTIKVQVLASKNIAAI